jgi:transitional endoplasmic reticulum ATPase
VSTETPGGTPEQDPNAVATPDELVGRLLWPRVEHGLYEETKETIRVLAEILGAPRVEPEPTGSAQWAAKLLGAEESALSKVERDLSNTQLLLHGYVLASWMETHGAAVQVFGSNGTAPQWRPLELGEEHTRSVPYHLSTYFPAGTLRDAGIIIHICGGYPADITVYTEPGRRDVAESVLDEFQSELKGSGNPYRGRVLQVTVDHGSQIRLAPMAPTTETRADLVLSDKVWREVELFLAAGTERREDLLALGLSTSRGLLLAGQPGVGKTKLGRIVAAEVAGTLTVLVADLEVMGSASENLYQEVERLGPTLVILEDIDAVADKGMRKSAGFSEFINALDGARVRNDILTLATTNDPGSLDPAVKRPGRFDVILEVPLPTQQAREEILRLYLPGGGDQIDVAAVAETLEGASGAELREVARRAVLEHGTAALTTRHLLDITRTGRWKPAPATGNYL